MRFMERILNRIHAAAPLRDFSDLCAAPRDRAFTVWRARDPLAVMQIAPTYS
jgi:hypothetical protein